MTIRSITTASLLTALAAPALAQPAFWADLEPGVVAYDPFRNIEQDGDIAIREAGLGEYTSGTNLNGQGSAAFGWAGTAGVDGFGIGHSGSTSNFQHNFLGEDSAAVGYEQDGRVQWLGVGNFPFDRNTTRQLGATATSTASNVWYQSMIVNRLAWPDAPSAADVTFAVGGFVDGLGGGLQVGYDDTIGDGSPDLVIRLDGTNQVIGADTASSATQLVITRLTINESGDDTIDVLVNPADVTSEPATYDFSFSANVTDSLTPFTQSKYESPGQSGVVFWDELILATDFASVTNPLGTVASLFGDLDEDGDIDVDDIDLLGSNIGVGTTPEEGDLNDDGAVTLDDLTVLLGELGTVAGDANLDQMVDTSDLAILAANFETAANSYALADYNLDGTVNTSDLAILAANFGFDGTAPVATAVAAVPEPATLALIGLGGRAALARRRA
ncbi:MAG: dockerin type I domain-containing protein [Planctomycetota bacterium]